MRLNIFFEGDRVMTPKGRAWVVGVNGGNMYFMIDGDKGASKVQALCRRTTFGLLSVRGFVTTVVLLSRRTV